MHSIGLHYCLYKRALWTGVLFSAKALCYNNDIDIDMMLLYFRINSRMESIVGGQDMKWLSNMKVTAKIVCLIAMAGIALATVGWTGASYLRAVQADMDQMYTQKMQAVRLLSECSITVRAVQARILENVSLTDRKQIEKNKRDIQNYMDAYEKTWREYETLDNGTASTVEVKKHWQDFRGSVDQMMELSLEGNQKGASDLYGTKAIKEIIDWDNSMVPLRQAVNDEAEAINNQNQQEVRTAIYSMSIKTLVAMVLMGVFGWMLIRTITHPLTEMIGVCQRLSAGDFRQTARQINRNDEFGDMANIVTMMREKLNGLMGKTSKSAEQIAAASEELTASSQQSAQASQQVAVSVTQASDAVTCQQQGIEKSTESVRKVAGAVQQLQGEADRVASHASAAYDQAVAGNSAIEASVAQIRSVETTVGESAATVDKLGQRSQEIGQIVATISGIAEQTNLLALNAAIEAARAGEQGRGFSVVADEVRKLAEQSQEAAQQISLLILGIQSDTSNAVNSMKQGSTAVADGAKSVENLRATFDHIRNFVDNVSKEVAGMAEAIRGVAEDTQIITKHIAEIDRQGDKVASEMQSVSALSEEQSAAASEIASASDSLARLAQELQGSLQAFEF